MSEPFSACYVAMMDESVVETTLFCRPISYIFAGFIEPLLMWLPATAAMSLMILSRTRWNRRSDFNFLDDPFLVLIEI